MIKVYLLSLGCSRNMVDSEVLLALLRKSHFQMIQNPEEADVAIVNTCGFIQDAKEESIEIILQLARMKSHGKPRAIIVCGCLAQRYSKDLTRQVKEIDAVFGTSDFVKIPEMIDRISSGEKIHEVTNRPRLLCDHNYSRDIFTPAHYAYIKIQEGCSNRCSYCVIPDLRGPLRSRTVDSLVKEIKTLCHSRALCHSRESGNLTPIKELILIGQDTTSFGLDRGKPALVELLRRISRLMKNGWVRLLYTHPKRFTNELIDVIADTPNICKYVDLPIQHINDTILKRMNRKTTRAEIEGLIERLRKKIKNVTIRTSIITGFPGETSAKFKELVSFLEDVKFDRLGAFIYSREEGTRAGEFDGQVSKKVKNARFDEIMSLQREISREKNEQLLGKRLKVLIDEKDLSGTADFVGRSHMDAPEVDGVIYVKGKRLKTGQFADVTITGATEYDLIGEGVE
ncbi:MAG: 30S ribosomal protein S12 methylthiotransferase RimO [Candidatus Omnitrophota bacterium]